MAKANWKAGIGDAMRPAVAFAESNGFAISLTGKNHLKFEGHGALIISSTTPRSRFASKQAIGRMRLAMRAAEQAAPARVNQEVLPAY